MEVRLEYDAPLGTLRVITVRWRRYGGGEHALQEGVPDAWRCGFVGVPVGHPLYEYDYRVADKLVDVYGGLQCNARRLLGVPDAGQYWYFGVEFLHRSDDALRWSLEKVAQEVVKLAKQLNAVTPENVAEASERFLAVEDAWRRALVEGVESGSLGRATYLYIPGRRAAEEEVCAER